MKDLVILAADRDLESALRGLLGRPDAIGIRPIEADLFLEPEHDPACALRGVSFLTNYVNQYRHALLMFDYEGSGKEKVMSRQELQDSLNADFQNSTWKERAQTIVLQPELEAWVWSVSPHVDDIIGWKDRKLKLRSWLIGQSWLTANAVKPSRPKEALEAALRAARKPRSASLYKNLAEKVSLQRCHDIAFAEFRKTLYEWFPRP